MKRSLGLTAYRALARRSAVTTGGPTVARPAGELVWIHAGEPGNLIAVKDLAARLCAMRDGLHVMITLPEGEAPPSTGYSDAALILQSVPGEHPDGVTAFLDHWQPDSCIWVWGALRPNAILEVAVRRCPLFLIDVDTRGFDGRRDRWLPDVTRRLLLQFTCVLARSGAGARRLAQLGLPKENVQVTSPLVAGGQALPCLDSDLAELSSAVAGRPMWFATRVLPEEVAIVLSAHARALRLSHRLLLILHPADPAQTQTVMEQCKARGHVVVDWSEGAYPDDSTQVMVTEDPEERGLFFRMAPVSFIGSSLRQVEDGCDPFEAAALGSAVLYGPKVRHFMPSYTRLAAAGAARIVNDADALGTAVSRLIAPDQAAAMAHAGWDVISQGAALTDKVIDLVQDALDKRVSNT